MSRDEVSGNRLRERRIEAGLSADQAASIYGQALKGVAITRKAYLKMEEGYLPKSLKRRAILAGMLGIAPALLLPEIVNEVSTQRVPTEKGKALNIKEYRAKLLTVEKQGYRSADEALREATRRIHTLHSRIFYVSSQEQEEMKLLLCGYQTLYADIARERGDYKLALAHYNMAITLAYQEGFTDFEAAAICQRGNLFLDQHDLNSALRDFQRAASFKTPDQLRGYILSLQAVTQMRLAHTEQEKTAALRLIDETENLASPTIDDALYQHIDTCSFPPDRYLRFWANTLMLAPIKKLRSPGLATEILNELEIRNHGSNAEEKRHNAYHQMECNLAYARIYKDQEYFPVVSTLLQEALTLAQQINSRVHLRSISNLHNDLKMSSYGKNEEVAMLGVEIMKVQHPHLFN
ncbi:hypothetical protein KSF_077260 [Reticulibacter mediterranei]|uniref:Uncharacterized protein n=1 Tax=Reticulibacter mediterranei TaxID=2778369 RepID=A0A8J3IS90_9CHLR|nr:tetratricopeptide repeat protein [Reticulibacter mediterranei]GHO97678.1 hypothetical protein KSF_077260 [Reticulibacter mediterranei]